MAPSRAVQRCATSLRNFPTPRTLIAACRVQTRPHSSFSAAIASSKTSRSPSRIQHIPVVHRRMYSKASGPEPPDYLSEGELHVFNKIKTELNPVRLEVQDISGGCGSMYALDIESPKFHGLPVIKQHKLVNQVLAEEIKQWHGVQLKTRAV